MSRMNIAHVNINKLEAQAVEHIYVNFEECGLFQAVETSYMRFPLTIRIKYTWKQRTDAKDLASTAFSQYMLTMVPAAVNETHRLKVDILQQYCGHFFPGNTKGFSA